jgi:hypothetical protein
MRVDALNLVYLDEDGNVLSPGTLNPVSIRSIQVAIVAKTGREERGYKNNETFQNLQDEDIYTAPGDRFRRKLLTCELRCRNLGL